MAGEASVYNAQQDEHTRAQGRVHSPAKMENETSVSSNSLNLRVLRLITCTKDENEVERMLTPCTSDGF